MNPPEKQLSVPSLLAVLDERTERILGHVERMDSKLDETCLKLAKTEEIAGEAKKIASRANSRIDVVIIGGIITFITAIGSMIAGWFGK